MLSKVKEFKKIYILCHVSPDGDCLGSAFGLKELLKDNYDVEAEIVSEHSEYLSFLGETTLPGSVDFNESMVISVDTGAKSRVCDQNFTDAKYILRIDHHKHVEDFGNLDYVKDTISSCSEVITDYAVTNKLIISKKAAYNLFTGIVSDTGRFVYRGVNSRTFELTSILLQSGIEPTDIYDNLYQQSIESLKFKSFIYSNIKETDKKVLYLYISKEIMSEYNLTEEEAAVNVNAMSGVKDRPIYVLLYDKGDVIRARIRSNKIKVNEVASKFNGGGHELASGATCKNIEEMFSLLDELGNLM